MTSQSTATGILSVYVKCRNLISFKTPFPSPVYNWFNNFFHTENQIRCFCFQSSNIIKKNSKTEETSIVFPCVFALLGPSFFLIFQDFFCHLLSLSRTFSSNHVRVGLLMTNSTSFSLRVSWFLLHSLRIIFPDMEILPNLWWFYLMIFWCCSCSVAQSCLTLCDPMDCSWPGLPVPHCLWTLPKFTSVVSVMPSSHLIL